VARLIRTEKEVEGRWTEQWIVVEEDVLEQWPDGPLEVVGRPAPRIDGLARARGEAVYTADIVLPGMLHAAILRSPDARARLTRIDADGALAASGVRAVPLPADDESLTDEPQYHGAPVAAVAAETFEQAREALERLHAEWDVQQPLLDPDEAVARGSFVGDVRRDSRGDVERGFAEAEVVVEGEYRTQSVLHNALETHQSICV